MLDVNRGRRKRDRIAAVHTYNEPAMCRDINNNFSFFFPLSHSLFFLYFLVRQSADVTVEREDREAERGKLGNKSPSIGL